MFLARSSGVCPFGSATTVPEIVSPALRSSGRFTMIVPGSRAKVTMVSPLAVSTVGLSFDGAFCVAPDLAKKRRTATANWFSQYHRDRCRAFIRKDLLREFGQRTTLSTKPRLRVD